MLFIYWCNLGAILGPLLNWSLKSNVGLERTLSGGRGNNLVLERDAVLSVFPGELLISWVVGVKTQQPPGAVHSHSETDKSPRQLTCGSHTFILSSIEHYEDHSINIDV